MGVILLTKSLLYDLARQKTIIFSSFILPIVTIWSTWWVTVDIPMIFALYSGQQIQASMIDVHVVTGGLTAMAITSGLFGFIITADYQKISTRLKQVGYSSVSINSSILLTLFSVLTLTSLVAISFSLSLAHAESRWGLILSILLVTMIYTGVGNLIGTVYPNLTAGSLLILIFSFMDLMLFTNPMGEGLYLQGWTYYTPGFWPVQLALEAGFIGFPTNLIEVLGRGLLYFIVLLGTPYLLKKLGLHVEVHQ